MERIAELRNRYSEEIARAVNLQFAPVQTAYAAVPRERFLGAGPWLVFEPGSMDYSRSSDADPAHIYRNVVVALDPAKGLNNGQPTFWAYLFDRLRPQAGERAIHIGAGTGYYTAILAELVGPRGRVTAIEYEPDLAARAAENLAERPNVAVLQGDALHLAQGEADVIVASCGFDVVPVRLVRLLRDGGRLLIPLTAEWPDLLTVGGGTMLMVTRRGAAFDARFVGGVGIYHCMSGRSAAATRRLAEALGSSAGPGGIVAAPPAISALHLDDAPGPDCWLAGEGWWLERQPP